MYVLSGDRALSAFKLKIPGASDKLYRIDYKTKRAKYGTNSNVNRRLSGLSSMRRTQGPGTERKG